MINVCTIKWQEDEAFAKGTQELRYLVQILHEAQANPSLQPMVHMLMRSNNLFSPSNREAPNQAHSALRESE